MFIYIYIFKLLIMVIIKKKNETRHDWMRKVIYQELCKKLKFDLTPERYIHNHESALDSEIYKILWDFEIRTNIPPNPGPNQKPSDN